MFELISSPPVTPELREVLDASKKLLSVTTFLSGSRVMAPDTVVETTDYDYMTHVPVFYLPQFFKILKELEFTPDVEDDYARTGFGDLISYRKGLTNIVVFSDRKLHEAYRTATAIGILMPQVEKERKIKLFDVIARNRYIDETPSNIW